MPSNAPGAVPDLVNVPALLAQAGYTKTGSTWTRAGHALDLTIAAPEGREPYDTIATKLKLQLAAAGIPATVVTPTASQLYQQLLTANPPASNGGASGTSKPIDILVGPQPTGGDPATELASWFGCVTTGGASAQAPSAGPFGWCDQAVQPTVDAALTGTMSVPSALAKIEPLLWAQAVEIPLFQVSDELAVGSAVTGVDAGPPFAGPFFGAAEWGRTSG
jgi:ABC-type transport system substrate-binding protein